MIRWTDQDGQRKHFHAWLREVRQVHKVDISYEGVKRHALGVSHLAEYNGTFGQAQKAVLDWVAQIKAGQAA